MTPCVTVDNVSKQYRIGSGLSSLRSLFSDRHRDDDEVHWALRDVSLTVEPGEALAIIGPNGAGKTTMLKILSRVTEPTRGRVIVDGRLSALIELGAGFHPDLTGRDNVFLNGTILGMKRREIEARFDEIVAFSGIGRFLDTPVKRYSSGMYARLGFAIAAHVDPDVLLVDEVLAVGDYAFQQKCHARMDKLRERGTSLVFVSHNMEAVRRVCDRGVVMYRGRAIFEGSASEAVVAYSDALREAARAEPMSVPDEAGLSQRVMTFEAEIEKVRLRDATGNPVSVVESGSRATVAVDVRFNEAVDQPIFSMTVRTPDGRLIYDVTTRWMGLTTGTFEAGARRTVEFDLKLPLLAGEYHLGVDVLPSDLSRYFDRLERALGFVVRAPEAAQGLVDLGAQFRVVRPDPTGVET